MQKLTETEMILEYIGMVHYYAGRLRYGYDLEDIASEGYIGLLRAIRTFDPEQTTDFSRHAKANVRNAILKFVRKPAYGPYVEREIYLLTRSILADGLEEESVEVIAEKYNVTAEKAKGALKATRMQHFSMQMLSEDGNEWSDSIGNKADYTHVDVGDFINSLSNAEKELLSYLYKEIPQDVIGTIFGVSQMTVSRYVKALRKKYNEWSEMV